MSNFKAFKNAVAVQFSRMQGYPLFRVAVEKDQLWEMYINSFPPESNPIYRQRSEHDCGCCRNFVRSIGDVVAVIEGKIVSLWDVTIPDEPSYRQVAYALSGLVHSAGIADHFLHYERMAGTDKNFEQIAGAVNTWDHFFVNLPTTVVRKKADIPTIMAALREPKNVLLRSLAEITDEAVDTVLELIAQDSLYRGQEHKFAVESFQQLKRKFNLLTTDAERDIFAWTNSTSAGAVAKIRNTVIGTLLVDLSSGADLEQSVKAFEVKVAPTNYKRPTALVTKAMVENAKQAVEALGLTSALKRRYATIHDITVNNIVFANRDAKRSLDGGDVFAELATTSAKTKNLDRVEEMAIDEFISGVLPRIESIEIMVENRHASNFVSLIAPDDPTGGSHISYQQYRRAPSPNGGMLDLDANGVDGPRADPAENIFYADRKKMREGVYALSVNNFSRRSDGRGFVVEIEFDGQLHRIEYDKVLASQETTQVAKIQYSQKAGFEIIKSLPSSQTSRQLWGLNTQAFHPVNVLMLSPNHWDDRAIGNKHYLFMIDGCRNDGSARGFFNEFLKGEMDKHRKVLEMVGSKVKVDNSDQQLPGLGFSSTMRNSIVCRVKGNFTRMLKITF